jgi:hypothetical protein
VRIKQETSSASADAALWTKGCGTKGDEDPLRVGLAFANRDFAASYVVKKAPAICLSELRASSTLDAYMREL